MPMPNSPRDIEFGGPATYRIVVQGALSEDWSDRLAGLTITSTGRGDAAPHTTLAGPIRDQAELAGVLETLYELHLPILEVEAGRGGGRSRWRQVEDQTHAVDQHERGPRPTLRRSA